METSESDADASLAAAIQNNLPQDSVDADMATSKIRLNTPEECLEYWNSSFAKDELTCLHFREWWRQKIPHIFSPKPSMNFQRPMEHIEEEDVQKFFIDVLERFLCNGNPQDVFQELSSLNDPPSQCCKVFKMGDPTYSCRDCGLDPTCVLCVECFKNSEHMNHRYKMATSHGGGYCDCGDPEAWKKFPHCATHILGTQTESTNPLNKLPLDIQLRARQVFSTVLKYVFELLTLDSVMKLPSDLQYKERDSFDPLLDDILEVENMYATVLYNDEIHTFEQVINTLRRAVNCDRNQAASFVSFIDREGRSLVKCGPFQVCTEVKRIVEKVTSPRPLQVKVIHSHVVAHQLFAMRLVAWLEVVLAKSEGFRALFSMLLLEQEVGNNGRKQPSLLEGMLRKDTVMWKAARAAIHHLLITGMLMENASKKEFAIAFTNNYGNIIKDFIQDDQDHTFSVTSLSVQLFTVPTLAHHLIAQHDVLSIILRTFMSECKKKVNTKGKLEFDRVNVGMSVFRRTNYSLIDLRYLLSVPPSEFDDNIRRGFLHGFSLMLDILSWMQGMDSHVRQVNQHVEFEADWENGFKLHIQLTPVISLALRWCAADKVVFIKAYRMLLKRLKNEVEEEHRRLSSDSAGSSFDELEPQSNQPQQELLPKSQSQTKDVTVDNRFCAESVTYCVASQPVSMHLPLNRLLGGLNLYLDSFNLTWDSPELALCERPTLVQILELPLRTTVMVAQIYAGMWRRNGYSLQHQIYFYHDARCRGEMYDRDVELLQFCGATLPADEFLLHCLNKFGLTQWAEKDFEVNEEESTRHLTILVEEFFTLIITLISERYVPGVGAISPEDMLKKEIVQALCVEPLSHSALSKALPEDVCHTISVEKDKVVDQVAVFKRPNTSTGKGVFELKDEYYSWYDVFFYHYTREKQSKAEEAMRARLKGANKPQVLVPPQLPPLCSNFRGLTSLLKSDLLLYLLHLVLTRADNLKSRCFSEDQVYKVLYLIGIGLREEEVVGSNKFGFSSKCQESSILSALEALAGSHRIESHKELLAFITKKMKSLLGLDLVEAADDVGDDDPPEEDEEVKAKKAKAAAARRAKILQQMAAMQKSFMAGNQQLFEETPSGLRDHKVSVCDWDMDTDSNVQVCLGPNRSQPSPTDTHYTCILCQEDEELDKVSKTLVMASYIQKSTVLARRKNGSQFPPTVSHVACDRMDTFPLLAADLHLAPHTSSCGHVMHATCWEKYFEDVMETERRRHRSRHPATFDVDNSEFLCPLCRSLSNSVITIIPQYHLLQRPHASNNEVESQVEPMENNSGQVEEMAVQDEDGDVNGAAAVVTQCETMETVGEMASTAVAMEVGETSNAADDLQANPCIGPAVETKVTVNSPEGCSSQETSDDSATCESKGSSSSSSDASSPTQLADGSSRSCSTSDSTYMSADESPKDEDSRIPTISVTGSDGNGVQYPAAPNISYSKWLEALFIALKYSKTLSPEATPEKNGGESQPQDEQPTPKSNLVRYYTCPLDQVVSEMEAREAGSGRAFGALFQVPEGGELAFNFSVYEIMNTFCQTTYRTTMGEVPSLLDERIPILVWISCSYTILSIVVSQAEADKPTFGCLSSRQNDCLSTLIRFCGIVGSNFGEPKVIRSHSLKLLSTLLEVDTNNPSILEIDMFGLLISLTYSLPSLFNGEGAAPLPSCNIQDQHLLRLTFTAHLTQLLFNRSELEATEADFDCDLTERDQEMILELLAIVAEPQTAAGIMYVEEEEETESTNLGPAVCKDPGLLWRQLMVRSLGFLRCAALFYHYLSGVAPPSELNSMLPPDEEFYHLGRYLALPTSPRHLLHSEYFPAIIRKWCNHPNAHIAMANPNSTERQITFSLEIPRLITLPDDYSDLIYRVSVFTCPSALGDDSRVPCMCLVCGQILCSGSYCCQGELDGEAVGACNAHCDKCGARVGIFLRVRECKVMMLSSKTRGSYVSPPYLDQYGETDQGLRRGNPLRLCHESYRKLQRTWLNHGIPEDVTHSLESMTGISFMQQQEQEWINI